MLRNHLASPDIIGITAGASASGAGGMEASEASTGSTPTAASAVVASSSMALDSAA